MDPIVILALAGIFFIFRFFLTKGSLKGVEAKKIIENGGKIIDVRSPGEFKSGHFKGALNIQHDKIAHGIKKAKINKETPVILYCASGMRSSNAVGVLKADGFTNVYNAGTQDKLKKLLS